MITEPTSFLELKDTDEKQVKSNKMPNTFEEVEIVVDPELEDESTIDINNYIDKTILQCRICGNMFPTGEMLDEESECPICGETSPNGFIYKGKIKAKNDDSEDAPDDANEDTLDNIQEIPDGTPIEDI